MDLRDLKYFLAVASAGNFRRAAEVAVRCANAQARMEAARARYEALLPPAHDGADDDVAGFVAVE